MTTLIPYARRNMNMQRMFDDLFNDSFFADTKNIVGAFKLDIHGDETSYTIEAELPGMTKENVNIKVDKDILTISTTVSEVTKDYLHKERRTSSASRSVRLTPQVLGLSKSAPNPPKCWGPRRILTISSIIVTICSTIERKSEKWEFTKHLNKEDLSHNSQTRMAFVIY